MIKLTNILNEAGDMGDLFYDYLNDKATLDDLAKSNSKIKLTKKGVDDVLRNNSMLDILSSIHDIPVNKIKQKLKKLSKSNVLEYADALEKTKEVDPESLDEANPASTLKSDVARELKVSPSSLSVGEGFTPKKTKDGNRIVVIGLDIKVKNISIPQADYFGKEITNGGYLIVKANASTGKLMKVLGRVEDRRDIKLSDYVNEGLTEMSYYHPTEKELRNVKQGVTIIVNWKGQGKVPYKVLSKNNKELTVKSLDGKRMKFPYEEYDSVHAIREAISRSFSKAAEKYQEEQLKLQDIQDKQEEVVKKFKRAKGKEKETLKKDIIKLHKEQKDQMKKVKDAEAKFEKALNNEPVELEEGMLNEDFGMTALAVMAGVVGGNIMNKVIDKVTPRVKDQIKKINQKVKNVQRDRDVQKAEKMAKKLFNDSEIQSALKGDSGRYTSLELPDLLRSKLSSRELKLFSDVYGKIWKMYYDKSNESTSTRLTDILEEAVVIGESLKKGDRVKIKKGHDKTANGRVKISGKSGTIVDNTVNSYIVDVDGLRKFAIPKENVVKESTGCKCGCGCDGSKKDVNEKMDVVDRKWNIGKVTDERGDDWYVKKIDSTHMYMANDPKYLKKDRPSGAMAHHVGQHRDAPYYSDLRSWLKESIAEEKIGKYDLGVGQFPTGLVIWDRNQKEHGDYKMLARIDKRGNIHMRVDPNKLPSKVRKFISDKTKIKQTMSATQPWMESVDKKMNEAMSENVSEQKVNKKDIVFKEKTPSGYFRVVANRDSSGRGTQDKFSMYIIDKRGDIKQGWGSHPSLSGAKKFISDKDYDPKKSGDGIFDSVNENIDVYDERVYNKGKGIIIMLDKNGKKTSAIFKNKKNADKYNRNKQSDLEKLYKVAEKTPYPKAIDESMNEAVRPSKTIEKIKKVVDDSSRARVDGVMVDLTTAGMVMQVYNQVNDRMKNKLNDLDAKKLISVVFKLIK